MGRRWWENLGTFALALLLAVVVWAVAVNEENPNEEKLFPTTVKVGPVSLPENLILVEQSITQTAVTIRAPRTVWDTLVAGQIHITADLAGLPPGEHVIALRAQLDVPIGQVTKLNPATIRVTLESRAARELPVSVEQVGEPARGYEAGHFDLSTLTAVVSGPASAVDRVSKLTATISLEGLKTDLRKDVALDPVDASGKPVADVSIEPASVPVKVPITQKQGFRDVAVTVDYAGQVAAGYRITNITVAPPVITVSSSDPQRVEALPGFVKTQALDLTGASDDIVVRLPLALPEGVSVEGEPSVQVQVNIAAIESSQTEQRQLEFQGLGPGLSATASPDTVVVLVSGPLPVLDRLKQEDVRVILDVTGLEPGTYSLTPEVSLLPEQLRAESVLPATIEVVITVGVTPSVTPTNTVTPTAPPTVVPTRRPTLTPTATPTETLTPTAGP
ncbi:MAG TPA: CdaR family protein [Terriglobia bacterium]